jgi:hypothetical protein
MRFTVGNPNFTCTVRKLGGTLMSLTTTPRNPIVIDPADVVEPEGPSFAPPQESDPSNITLDQDSYNASGTFIEQANIAVSIAPLEEVE